MSIELCQCVGSYRWAQKKLTLLITHLILKYQLYFSHNSNISNTFIKTIDLKPSNEIEEIEWFTYSDIDLVAEVDKKIFNDLKLNGRIN